MKHRFYRLLILLTLSCWVILGVGHETAAFESDIPFNGLAHIDGPLQLDLAISPPINTPGDILSVSIRLRNQTKVTVNPILVLQLPAGLSPDTNRIPAGMTLNLQSKELTWLPILPANGGETEIEVALRVETADITQPAQMVTAVLKYEGGEQTANASIWMGMPPTINRILSLPSVAVGQPVQLLADIVGSGPVTQMWDLGDGRRVAVNDPVVVYPAAGTYEIVLEAANPFTAVRETAVTQTGIITIVPQPSAQFVPDDPSPGINQPITFVNQSGGQPPLIYRWDFGDGTTTTEPSPSHQYAVPGAYTVNLIVENGFGQSEAFGPVTVGAPPVADMEIDSFAPAGQPIIGQAFGDDTVTGYRWDMGDGQTQEGELISHPYRLGGDYYVSMTAYNEYGGTEIGQWVQIESGLTSVFLPMIMRLDNLDNNFDDDPYGLTLDPVSLDEPFVMGPMILPEGLNQSEQLFSYINEARRQFDLPPLNFVSELGIAAQQHVGDMAAYRHTAHTGYDGSFPAERLLWLGYRAGYAGEATAWGFEHPYQAVEYWINSPGHRRIILNRYATDVGTGFTTDFNTPNVWYWTAEFGNVYAAPPQQFIRLDEPLPNLEFMISEGPTFSWNWPLPLEPNQQFTVYRIQDGAVPFGSVWQPQLDTRYILTTTASNDWNLVGDFEWQVVLEENSGSSILTSETRGINFLADPNLPLPTVMPTAVPTATPLATPILPTPTPQVSGSTPFPTPLPPPIIVTATPSP